MTQTLQPAAPPSPAPPKKKSHRLLNCSCFLLVLILLIVGGFLAYPSLQNAYFQFRDQYAIREPDWAAFEGSDKEGSFLLLRINGSLVDKTTIAKEDFFFKNRLSVFGWQAAYEECRDTQYQCGDGKWQDFTGKSRVLASRCKVRVKPETFCSALLPGGTLISATDYHKDFNAWDNLFSEEALVFQVVLGKDQITIIQGVTKQESSLWHLVAKTKQKYVVQIGDEIVESTGTAFGTGSSAHKEVYTAVKQGTVKVAVRDGGGSTAVGAGKVSQGPAFDTQRCPEALKPCGNSCVPGNAVCCNELTGGSYCLSPLQCASNFSGRCSSNPIIGSQTGYCCNSSSDFADVLPMLNRGSYDCAPGTKFCGMGCIPEDRTCCYPDEEHCAIDHPVDIVINPISDTARIPRSYLNDYYMQLLLNPAYITLVQNPNFPSDPDGMSKAVNFFFTQMRTKMAKDAAASNPTKEANTYCTAYPNNCTTAKSGSSGGSNSTSCSDVFNKVKVGSCNCGRRNSSGWVSCEVQSLQKGGCTTNHGVTLCDAGGWVDGWIPPQCTTCR